MDELLVVATGPVEHVLRRLDAPEGLRLVTCRLPDDRELAGRLLVDLIGGRRPVAVVVLDAGAGEEPLRIDTSSALLPLEELLEELVWLGLDAERHDQADTLAAVATAAGVPEVIALGLSQRSDDLGQRAAQLAVDVVAERLPDDLRRIRRRRQPWMASEHCARSLVMH